jgi:hypothetical protein
MKSKIRESGVFGALLKERRQSLVERNLAVPLCVHDSITKRPVWDFDEYWCFIPMWSPKAARSGHTKISDAAIKNRSCCAHRLIFELLVAPIYSSDEHVLHRCGNAGCINPYHLYLGTAAQNRRDAIFHQDARRHLLNKIDNLIEMEEIYENSHAYGGWSIVNSNEAGVKLVAPLPFSIEKSISPYVYIGFEKCSCSMTMELAHRKYGGYVSINDDVVKNGGDWMSRLIYKLIIGPLNFVTEQVSHHCGNSDCINPHHLFVEAANCHPRDAVVNRDPRYVLTTHKIHEIERSNKTYRELSIIFGVHAQTIGSIKRRFKSFNENVIGLAGT